MKNKKRLTALAMAVVLSAGTTTGAVLTATAADTSSSSSSTDQNTAPTAPPEGAPSDSNGQPPTPPSGSNSSDSTTPPAKPDGDTSGPSDSNGQPPAKPGDSSSSSSSSDNSSQPPEMPSGGNAQGGPGGGADTQSFDYSGSYTGKVATDGEEITSESETIEATDTDQNALLSENGGTLEVKNGTVTKSGDDTNGDNCNFYGLNSISLTVGEGSKTYLSDTTLTATSEGSNAIFATDSGTAYAENVTINTSAGNSRGLDATYGGTVIADKTNITTQGEHCAALATDRGGGSISVTNSELSTAGSGSPLLYSTGDIEVDGVTGTATGSQIAGMEGLNKILILDSNLTSTITDKTASDPVADGIIIYQSTSGDAETSTGEAAEFQAVNSTLSSSIESGAFVYVTNTTANRLFSNTTLNFDSTKAKLLYIAGNNANSWGTAGSNGGTVIFTADNQILAGDVTVDTISSLDFYLLNSSTYTGAMSIEENADGGTAVDSPITVNVSADSTWIVTGDTTISNLNAEDGAKIVDADGKTVTIVANGSTVVEGDSDITLTVTGSYSNTVTTGEANEVVSDYIDRTDFDSHYGTSTAFVTSSDTSVTAATETSADTTETATVDTTKDEKSYAGWIIGGIVIAAAAACGVTVYISRKKKQ